MRLSWLAQLFTRNKSRSETVEAPPPRFRTEPAGRAAPGVPNRPRLVADPRRAAPSPDERRAGAVTIEPSGVVRPAPSRPVASEDELVRTTKMPAQEELAIQVAEGMKGLSKVLGSIDEKLVAQQRATELVAERLQSLPRVLEGLVSAEKVSLETLRDLRASLERQGDASDKATTELGKLPTLVETIGSRIHEQTNAAAAVRTSVESIGGSVRGLVDVSQRAQTGLIAEFRRGQEEQHQRLQALVDRQRLALWVVGGLAAAVVVCLTIVLIRFTRG